MFSDLSLNYNLNRTNSISSLSAIVQEIRCFKDKDLAQRILVARLLYVERLKDIYLFAS